MQVSVGRFGKVEVHGTALSGVAACNRLVFFLVGLVAAERTAYDVETGIVGIDGTAVQTGILQQTAAVQGVVHAAGIDGTATAHLVQLFVYAFLCVEGVTRLAVHDGDAVEHHVVGKVGGAFRGTDLAVYHVVDLLLVGGRLDVAGEDGGVVELPGLYQSVAVAVAHVVLVALGKDVLDAAVRGQRGAVVCGKARCTVGYLCMVCRVYWV